MKKLFFTKTRNFLYKLTHWEFWPFSVFYFPVYFYYAWLAVRCRSFFFFTAANPSIDFGGMLGESKSEIFDLIPEEYLPAHILVKNDQLKEALLFAQDIGFPVIAKPDIGERGKLVEVVYSEKELTGYHERCLVPYLIQEFVNLPLELGLFYVKLPGADTGNITSLVQKEFLGVTGDGKLTVRELLAKNPRANLLVDFEHPRFEGIIDAIPEQGESVKVELVGNHSRGTVFLNANAHITARLEAAFNQLSNRIEGFHFGRFDLRCASFADLEDLKNFKILELNGAGSEPGHIYHPGASIFKAYRSVFEHLRILAKISLANRDDGIAFWKFQKGTTKLREIKKYNRSLDSLL